MDGAGAAAPGLAAALPVLPEGEVWVAMPYKPAFPGIVPVDETPLGVITDQAHFPVLRDPSSEVEIGLRCRPAVARWIGIHLEAFYGTDQYRVTWRGKSLEIYEDPEGESRDAQPRVVRSGDDGRYEIRDLWYPVAPAAVAELGQRHPDALAALTGDDAPAPVSHMLAYLTDHPGAPSTMGRNIEAALARLAADLGR
ncbi:hypothetical protein [Amycolatopsis sp. 195334CR]|uniref:hypothetical protein n=1 Tax=Amycolatopsis sp. 195334CR TaxID=2814588 RepID=UPI001A8C3A23|nr:hypothetical protein [Amycolatopsis sp. 195334CR]MBN6034132.1 hypothetical protein [Amycolatopsis sp. 195334CR]